MFDSPAPRLFAMPPGIDFPAAFVSGLLERTKHQPREDLARTEVFLNSSRMRRAVTEAFIASGARLLPKLRVITDIGADPAADLPPAVPPLRRRLELARLVTSLLSAQPDLAPRSAIYDLADSLAVLMDEMQGEGVTPQAIAALDVSDHSAHWKRTQDFLSIIAPYFSDSAAPDAEARQRLAAGQLVARWQAQPPSHPVIVAGSSGSRGTTALIMAAVARLPQGALVLPGFDFELPQHVWDSLSDALTSEDHPQFRYRRLLDLLDLKADAVLPWAEVASPQPLNGLISLSLRPAPITDQWLTEGQRLPDLPGLTDHVTLIEAQGPRAEATALALILRDAAETGTSAALISPDRALTRRVTAALDRWGIRPDDSAGRPLALSAPGRLLRHVSRAFGRKLTSEVLLTLLKHPLTANGGGRGEHLRMTRDLELRLRRHGPAFPTTSTLLEWAAAQKDLGLLPWAIWVTGALDGTDDIETRSLAEHVAHHVQVVETLARGPDGSDTGELWRREAGEAARAAVDDLRQEAPHGGTLDAAGYDDLFHAILARGEVRESVQGHPLIRILGPREARECSADLVILAGLNDGSWPSLPSPDPWLNRQMRQNAGLLLPERQIGLSAHDYQQAIAARTIVLSRALRDAESETVPSRWLNRLLNLMGGLPSRNGPAAIAAMKARGQTWLDMAQRFDAPQGLVSPVRRPAPRPPVETRPNELAVTSVRTLIRDPYAIYARYILRLRPLDPLRQTPDAMMRGSVLHKIVEDFIRESRLETIAEARTRLLAAADRVLSQEVPWPTARALWRARLDRAADAFLTREAETEGEPVILETKGSILLPALGFTLTARPDRVDVLPDGRLHILDYKTGTPPTQKQQAAFDKQLLLEAAMAERAAFTQLGAREVARISYIGLNSAAKIETTVITPELLNQVWHDLHRLISSYQSRDRGYAARRAVFDSRFAGDYDHLARFGEWEMTDLPDPKEVG